MTSYKIGKAFELRAKLHLQALGYKILFERFKCKFGEIDLLAIDGDSLVAIEVKYRKDYYDAKACLSLKQIQRIVNTLNYFVANVGPYATQGLNLRIDIIVQFADNGLEHIKNALQWEDVLLGV